MPACFVKRSLLLPDDEFTKNEDVETRPEKHPNRIARAADDRLAESVERRVDEDGSSRGVTECLQQRPKARRRLRSGRLDSYVGVLAGKNVPETFAIPRG